MVDNNRNQLELAELKEENDSKVTGVIHKTQGKMATKLQMDLKQDLKTLLL